MEPKPSQTACRASMTLTTRDDDILKTLALRVRMLSLSQIAQAWWVPTAAGEQNARRRLVTLAEVGFLGSAHVYARPLPEMERPVVAWSPHQPEPDFGAVSWTLLSRWTKPPRRLLVYFATRRGANQYGGRHRGGVRQELQATHDLGVAEVYLHLRLQAPQTATRWTGEDMLRPSRKHQKVPDALLTPPQPDAAPVVIEFGGAYDARRVRSFHRDCSKRKLSYEIW